MAFQSKPWSWFSLGALWEMEIDYASGKTLLNRLRNDAMYSFSKNAHGMEVESPKHLGTSPTFFAENRCNDYSNFVKVFKSFSIFFAWSADMVPFGGGKGPHLLFGATKESCLPFRKCKGTMIVLLGMPWFSVGAP